MPDGGDNGPRSPHCHRVNQRFRGWGGGRGLSRMFGIAVARPTSAHHLLFNPLRGAARCTYVTRPWNYNYWTSAAYILENSSFAPHRSLNANKAELSLRYMSPFPRLLYPFLWLRFSLYRINNNWANRIPLDYWYTHYVYVYRFYPSITCTFIDTSMRKLKKIREKDEDYWYTCNNIKNDIRVLRNYHVRRT